MPKNIGNMTDHELLEELVLQFVRRQNHNDVTGFCRIFNIHYFQAEILRLLFVLGTRSQADYNLRTGLCQVHRMGVTLGTESDDRNCLSIEYTKVAILIIILLDSHSSTSLHFPADGLPASKRHNMLHYGGICSGQPG